MTTNEQDHTSEHSGLTMSRVVGILIILLPIALLLYFLIDWTPEEESVGKNIALPEPEVVLEAVPEPVAPPMVEPVVETPPEVIPPPPLPELDDSDSEVLSVLATVNPSPVWSSWFNTDELVRKLTVAVDNLAAGEVPRKYLTIAPLKKPFQVIQVGNRYMLDPAGYQRFNSAVDTLTAIDTQTAVQAYQRYLPLVEKAYGELGYADEANVKQRISDAIDQVLQSPEVSGDIFLVRPSVMYKFTDPKLEALLPIQKLMVRLGPKNRAQIVAKLVEIKRALNELEK